MERWRARRLLLLLVLGGFVSSLRTIGWSNARWDEWELTYTSDSRGFGVELWGGHVDLAWLGGAAVVIRDASELLAGWLMGLTEVDHDETRGK